MSALKILPEISLANPVEWPIQQSSVYANTALYPMVTSLFVANIKILLFFYHVHFRID